MNLRRSSVHVAPTLALVLSLVLTVGACAYGTNVPATDDSPATGLPSADAGERRSREAEGDAAEAAVLPVSNSNDAAADARRPDGADDAAVRVDAAVPPLDASVDAADSSTTGAARAPSRSDLVITEIMFDPAGAEPEGEWFEITNVASVPVDLRGVVIRDGAARSHSVVGSVIVAPGAFVVFARSTSASVAVGVPASVIGYEYGRGLSASAGVILSNGATGAVSLEYGGATLTTVAYGTFGIAGAGASLSVRTVAHETNPAAASFCATPVPTPGLASACR